MTLIHGESDPLTPEYNTWRHMKFRCLDQTPETFKYYGERGIHVCDRWMKYENFLTDMGRRPSPSHSIDRINNDGNYEPGNCRWATKAEQVANRRQYTIVKTNTSGAPGVSWHKMSQKWSASYYVSNRKKFIGLFVSFEGAVAARKSAQSQKVESI